MDKQTIEGLAKWTAPKELQTKFGPRILRTAAPTDEFSAAWSANKEAMKEAGLSFRKDEKTQAWLCCWWSKLDSGEVEARKEAKSKSLLVDTTFTPKAPTGLEYLPFQKAGIEYAIGCFAKGTGCLIADEMGLGKTIQAIGCINELEDVKRVLVVCPNTLKTNWKNELKKWLVRKFRIAVQKAGEPYLGNAVDILIINYDIVGKFKEQLTVSQWDMRIVDEAHYLKNDKAQRTKNTLSIFSRRKLTLTGTPIENRPIELFTLINDIDPKRWGKKFTFAKRYCGATHNGFGWDFKGATNIEEMQDLLRGTIMVRRLKSQVLKDLPAKRRQIIELPSEGCRTLLNLEANKWEGKQEQMDALKAKCELAKAEEGIEAYRAAALALEEFHGANFEEMARVRHETGLAKLPMAIEFIRDSMEGGKVIVFCHHVDIVHAIKKEFPQAAVITGEVKAEDRQGEVERFQNNPECNIFIGNTAAEAGITLTAADHVIFVEPQWVPGKMAQAEDRAHRIGQTRKVLCSYLVLEGSIDSHMIRANVEKLDVIDRALDREHAPIEYAEPAVFAKKGEVKPMTARRQMLLDLAETITPEQIAEVHFGVQRIASMDQDGAKIINGVGFAKPDVMIGHELANCERLSKRQAALAMMLCRKYQGQLGEGCWTRKEVA